MQNWFYIYEAPRVDDKYLIELWPIYITRFVSN